MFYSGFKPLQILLKRYFYVSRIMLSVNILSEIFNYLFHQNDKLFPVFKTVIVRYSCEIPSITQIPGSVFSTFSPSKLASVNFSTFTCSVSSFYTPKMISVTIRSLIMIKEKIREAVEILYKLSIRPHVNHHHPSLSRIGRNGIIKLNVNANIK